MHTINYIKQYKIFSEKDLAENIFDDNTSIEIYANNMIFDFEVIEGNLLLRGRGCAFPNLISIKGNLSIDAENGEFPKLKKVGGNLTMHCTAVLDQLEKVDGNFKCIVDFNFKNLVTISGNISVKNALVTACNKALTKIKKVIPVNHQDEVESLSEKGIFNIDIFGDNIIIPHQEIHGEVNIYGKNTSFPNLEFIHGLLKIESRDELEPQFSYDFPMLKKMKGNLKLIKTKLSFPQLKEINGTIDLIISSYAVFHVMEKSGNIIIRHNCGAKLSELKEINGSFNNYGFETCYLDKLEKVKNRFCVFKTNSPNLTEVGDLLMNMGVVYDFRHLKRINGKVSYSHKTNFDTLEYLGKWGDERIKSNYKDYTFPSLKEIEHYLYDKNEGFEHKAKNIYFKVNDNLYVTKNKFIICKLPFYEVFHFPSYHISKLVSVLKLRHHNFENFITREYEREWERYETPFFTKILNKIEKLWNEVEPMKYEEFFNAKNRNFRLFCFSYFGVENLMEKLGAEKINEAEIEVNYYKYNENKNKVLIKKINRYEVHGIKNEKLRLFTRRRSPYSYAIRCWCPSTEKEHWLWIEEEYKDNALMAIASTFRVHENIIPYIKCLKRQGDLLICELAKEVIPEGLPRPLTAEEYFSLLEVET